MTPESLVRSVDDFLAGSRSAIVIEDGAVAFDLTHSKYSISGEHNKCLLHLWSAERNVVRRVLDAEIKHETLRLAVQRMGQSKPTKLEICRERDARTPSAKRIARFDYLRKLQRTLAKRYPGFSLMRFSTGMDLEQSFSPVYARGLMRQGQSAFAVLGVNSQEAQGSIDASLTFAILWMESCRELSGGKYAVQGLKLFLPEGKSGLVRERMAHLNAQAAQWQLYEFNEVEANIVRLDIHDRGNVATHLVRMPDEEAARERFAAPIACVRAIMPEVEVAVLSPAEIAFRHYGLEFARAQMEHDPVALRMTPEIVFGLGAAQQTLKADNQAVFEKLVRSIGEVRHAEGPRDHMLWRLHPERWLEALVAKNVSAIDDRLDATQAYAQVPAFSASDRAMMDVLALTHDRRLAVVELKADEDINLPLQGLDYWARVEWHHARGEFQRAGYFPSVELAAEKPLLFFVAPALRIHPSTDVLLRYLSPAIEWMLVGIDERWRSEVRSVFRKKSSRASASAKAA